MSNIRLSEYITIATDNAEYELKYCLYVNHDDRYL